MAKKENEINKTITFMKNNEIDMDLYNWIESKRKEGSFSGTVKKILMGVMASEGKVVINVQVPNFVQWTPTAEMMYPMMMPPQTPEEPQVVEEEIEEDMDDFDEFVTLGGEDE